LSPINEQTEHSINSYNEEDDIIPNNTFQSNWHQRDADATAQIATDAAADQVAADEDLARQLHEEMNGPPSRSRRGRGFR
jgi:predicted nucleic acid-binding protein